MSFSPKLTERFWSKVDMAGVCWEWRSAVHRDGYGVFGVYRAEDREALGLRTHNARAHRVAFALEHGACDERLFILHSCDNKLCVRPDHMRLGTPAENTHEAFDRGLQGGLRRTLTVDAVRKARSAYAAGAPVRDLAPRFGVSEPALRNAIVGRTWGHVAGSVCMQRNKLSPETAATIRALASQLSAREIADGFGVSHGHARKVIRRACWANGDCHV